MRYLAAALIGIIGFALSYFGGWIAWWGGRIEDAADWLAE